jgi:hypothetical protein
MRFSRPGRLGILSPVTAANTTIQHRMRTYSGPPPAPSADVVQKKVNLKACIFAVKKTFPHHPCVRPYAKLQKQVNLKAYEFAAEKIDSREKQLTP